MVYYFKAKSGICKKCNDMVMFLKKGEREDIFLVAIYSSFYYNL